MALVLNHLAHLHVHRFYLMATTNKQNKEAFYVLTADAAAAAAAAMIQSHTDKM